MAPEKKKALFQAIIAVIVVVFFGPLIVLSVLFGEPLLEALIMGRLEGPRNRKRPLA
jgi:hypothetical protein